MASLSASRRFLILLLVAAFTLAACGGSSDTDTTAGAAQTDDGASESSDTTATGSDAIDGEQDEDAEPGDAEDGEPIGDGDAEPESKEDAAQAAIDEMLALISSDGNSADQEEIWKDQERQTQELVAQCMRNEGFEYTPVDNTQFVSFSEDDWDPENRDWVAENGLGVNTNFSENFIGGEFGDDGPTDPNQIYVETLSDGERDAYYRALWGDEIESDAIAIGEEYTEPTEEEQDAMQEAYENRANKGCYDGAWEEVQSESNLDAIWGLLEDEFEDMEERVLADPRVADMAQAWTACMAEGGYDFASPNDMYEAAYERSNELYGSFEDPFADFTEEEAADLTDEQLDELFGGPPEIDEELAAEIAEWEIAMALTSFDCGEPELSKAGQDIWTELLETTLDSKRGEIAAALADEN